MKRIYSILVISLCMCSVYSQDIITLTTGEDIKAVIKEVSDTNISYYRYENQNGPLYKKTIESVLQIKYENGHIDKFNESTVLLNEELLDLSRKNPTALLKKGNKVFIEIPDEASRSGEKYFIEALKDWRYWTVVDDVNDAHFIIEFNIDKKAMLDKTAWAVFKTRENQEFKKSGTYRASTSAFSGYNAFKAVARKLVDKYFKKEFK